VITRGWEEGQWNYCLMDRVSLWDDEKVLEINGGESYTMM